VIRLKNIFHRQPEKTVSNSPYSIWKNEKILVVKPDKLSIGVYVLFTQPGEKWKMLLEKPLESEYKINIKKNALEEYRKGLLW
jgi:hypothetical protein